MSSEAFTTYFIVNIADIVVYMKDSSDASWNGFSDWRIPSSNHIHDRNTTVMEINWAPRLRHLNVHFTIQTKTFFIYWLGLKQWHTSRFCFKDFHLSGNIDKAGQENKNTGTEMWCVFQSFALLKCYFCFVTKYLRPH